MKVVLLMLLLNASKLYRKVKFKERTGLTIFISTYYKCNITQDEHQHPIHCLAEIGSINNTVEQSKN